MRQCNTLAKNVEKAVARRGIEAKVMKVDSLQDTPNVNRKRLMNEWKT